MNIAALHELLRQINLFSNDLLEELKSWPSAFFENVQITPEMNSDSELLPQSITWRITKPDTQRVPELVGLFIAAFLVYLRFPDGLECCLILLLT